MQAATGEKAGRQAGSTGCWKRRGFGEKEIKGRAQHRNGACEPNLRARSRTITRTHSTMDRSNKAPAPNFPQLPPFAPTPLPESDI